MTVNLDKTKVMISGSITKEGLSKKMLAHVGSTA